MKNQTKLFFLTLIIVISSVFVPSRSFSQEVTGNENLSNEKIVYWFYINLKILTDRETKMQKYDIRRLGDQISAGTVKEYDIKLWESLSNGSKIPIGPFYNYTEANQAKKFYNIGVEEKQDSLFSADKEIFWFVLRVARRERSNSYQLIRIPGAVASGLPADFENFLEVNLTSLVLTIGPFWDQPEAEEAKRRYRLH
jgi:hypothetical protein